NNEVALSESLLGLHLCTRIDGLYTAGKIVETEAYRAPEDKASHAYGNRRTNRTETMFKSGGHAYIYLCYGIHHLFNVVTGPADTAHAILVRALEPSDGIDVMLERRNMDRLDRRLTNGPGSLTKAMGITTHWDGVLLDTEKNIWIEDRERRLEPEDVIRSPRVGVDYAAECALWNWRFRIKNNQWCSPAK
ncbi:MAG: DNA-3-methyladenine glycosylase, partial [Saprospiraceae bacterium]|nr:DNA-3-methyladenine glycosylase [Saprospiraceae bacterium]